MYRIEVEGEIFQFDGTIQMTITSPIFSDTISHSLEASVTATPEIRRICGFINRPDISDNQTREKSCVIRSSLLYYSGTITFKLQGSKISFYFKEAGDFWSSIKDKMLADIRFDKIDLRNLDYAGIVDYIKDKLSVDIESTHTFPVVKIGENSSKLLPIKITFNPINQLDPLPVNEQQTPIIPFFYLKYIYNQIFIKNGVLISESAFNKFKYLKRLIMPNNYLLNEFSLNKTVVNTKENIISKITNVIDPSITTLVPHNLTTGLFIKIKNTFGIFTDDRIFQIEVADTLNFKLLGANFTAFTEYNQISYSVKYVNHTSEEIDYIFYAAIRVSYEGDKPEAFKNYYMYSDDWSGYVRSWPAPEMEDSPDAILIFPTDPDYLTHVYNNIVLLKNTGESLASTVPICVLNSIQLYSFRIIGTPAGNIEQITGLGSVIRSIDTKNHVPDIKINDFLKETQKIFGVIPFVKDSAVKIKTMKEILSSNDFIDISQYAEEITDIENPALSGYKLTFKADGNDSFYKTRLPVQSIDKYNLQPAVPSFSWLQYNVMEADNKTNDCRLVTLENVFYVYNESFIDTDSQWKFLCYNLIDNVEGLQNLTIESAFSPVLLAPLPSYLLTWVPMQDIPFTNKNFPSELKMAPRLLYYHGEYTIASDKKMIISSGDILPTYNPPLVDNDFLIRYDGDYGIIKNCLQEFINWQLNVRKDCKCIIHWPLSLLQNFDGSDKYRIRGVDYLVSEIKPNLTQNGITFSQTSLAKV